LDLIQVGTAVFAIRKLVGNSISPFPSNGDFDWGGAEMKQSPE